MRRTTDFPLVDALLARQAPPEPYDDDALRAALGAADGPDPEEIVAFVLGELSPARADAVREAIATSPFWMREYQDACFLFDAVPDTAAARPWFDTLVAQVQALVRSLAPTPLVPLTAALADQPAREEVQLSFPDGVRGALAPDGDAYRLIVECDRWEVGSPLAMALDSADGQRLCQGIALVADGLLGAEASFTVPVEALAGVHEIAAALVPVPAAALPEGALPALRDAVAAVEPGSETERAWQRWLAQGRLANPILDTL